MAVREGYKHADTPHAKTVMAPGWTYGCHSSKTGDKPRGRPSSYMVRDGYLRVTGTPAFREHTTHWLDKDHEGNPLKCGHVKKFRLQDPQCIGCANRD